MKKLVVIVATLALLLLVFTPAALAAPPAQEGWGGGGGWDGGGWGGGWHGGCRGTCYVVQYGDTLFSIGRRFGVNPWRIAQVNNLYNPHWIYAGQTLYIPPSPCCAQGNWPRPYPYYDGNPAGYYGGGGYNYGYGGY